MESNKTHQPSQYKLGNASSRRRGVSVAISRPCFSPPDLKVGLNQHSCQQCVFLNLCAMPCPLHFATAHRCFDVRSNALCLSYFEKTAIVLYTATIWAWGKMCKPVLATGVYLCWACLEKPPPKPIPLGLVWNKKQLWPARSEFQILGCQCEQ